MNPGASGQSVVAAPEDGRTSLTSPPPSLTHYERRKFFPPLLNSAVKLS
jgi:hypothetical protein